MRLNRIFSNAGIPALAFALAASACSPAKTKPPAAKSEPVNTAASAANQENATLKSQLKASNDRAFAATYREAAQNQKNSVLKAQAAQEASTNNAINKMVSDMRVAAATAAANAPLPALPEENVSQNEENLTKALLGLEYKKEKSSYPAGVWSNYQAGSTVKQQIPLVIFQVQDSGDITYFSQAKPEASGNTLVPSKLELSEGRIVKGIWLSYYVDRKDAEFYSPAELLVQGKIEIGVNEEPVLKLELDATDVNQAISFVFYKLTNSEARDLQSQTLNKN